VWVALRPWQVVDEEATHFRFNEESFENATRLFLVHRSFHDSNNAAGDSAENLSNPNHSSQPTTPRDPAVHSSVASPAKSVASPPPPTSTHAAPRAARNKAREVESRHPSFTSPTALRRGTTTTGTAAPQQQQAAELDPNVAPQPPTTSLFRRLFGGTAATASREVETLEQQAVAERSQSTLDSECVPTLCVCVCVRTMAMRLLPLLPAGGVRVTRSSLGDRRSQLC